VRAWRGLGASPQITDSGPSAPPCGATAGGTVGLLAAVAGVDDSALGLLAAVAGVDNSAVGEPPACQIS
jgi:hypothetical protein